MISSRNRPISKLSRLLCRCWWMVGVTTSTSHLIMLEVLVFMFGQGYHFQLTHSFLLILTHTWGVSHSSVVYSFFIYSFLIRHTPCVRDPSSLGFILQPRGTPPLLAMVPLAGLCPGAPVTLGFAQCWRLPAGLRPSHCRARSGFASLAWRPPSIWLRQTASRQVFYRSAICRSGRLAPPVVLHVCHRVHSRISFGFILHPHSSVAFTPSS